MTNLEKLYKAKSLIEEKSGGKLRFYCGIGGVNLRPNHDACVGMDMGKNYDFSADTLTFDFSAYIFRAKNKMTAEETQTFADELQAAADILKEVNALNIVLKGAEIEEWQESEMQAQQKYEGGISETAPKMEM